MATEEPEAVSRERIRGEADIRGPSIRARLRLESEVEKSTLIREWQEKTVEQASVGSGGVISRLFNGCVSLLRSILKCSKGKDGFHGHYTQLQESLLALILWSDDHHLSTGNLDTKLHDSEDLRELICSLLLSLADLLVNGLLQHIVTSPAERHAALSKYDMLTLMHETRKEVSIVETPVDYTRENVPSMAATLGTLADCLISLYPSLIEQSTKDYPRDQSGYFTIIEDRPPYHYHMELLESKFPNASRPLLERLGKCNWERYLRLKEQRETFEDEESVQVGDIESKSRFYDSALGTSVPAQSEFGGSVSTYAETVVSSRAASSHQKLPKLPREGRNGKRFICQVCNRVVAIRSSRDWKKHVFQDLLAYTCIYEGCLGMSLWEDRFAMTNHLAVEHDLGPEWKSHSCPLCGHHTGEGKELISLHISRHLEEIALNALPSGYDSDSESEANSTGTNSSHSASSQQDGSSLLENGHTALGGLPGRDLTPMERFMHVDEKEASVTPDLRHSDPPLSPPGPRDSARTQRPDRVHIINPNSQSPSGTNAPPDLDIPTPREGNNYADFEALRFAIDSWALRDKFQTRLFKKDQTRAIYQCRHFLQGCPWKLRAFINKDTGGITVSSLITTHTCNRDIYEDANYEDANYEDANYEDANYKPKYAKRGVVHTQRSVKDYIQRAGFHVTLETEPCAIADMIRERFGEEITHRLAAKSKQSILEARGQAIPTGQRGSLGLPYYSLDAQNQKAPHDQTDHEPVDRTEQH